MCLIILFIFLKFVMIYSHILKKLRKNKYAYMYFVVFNEMNGSLVDIFTGYFLIFIIG